MMPSRSIGYNSIVNIVRVCIGLAGEFMGELVAFAILLLVVLAGSVVRFVIKRQLDRQAEIDREMLKTTPQSVWRELDRQRTREDVRQHYWR